MTLLCVTWQRVLSVWWLLGWRSAVGIFVIYFAWGFVFGFVGALYEWTPGMMDIATQVSAWPVAVVWYIVVIRMALQKQYREFQIALVAREELTVAQTENPTLNP